jgi:hypothetical protein
MRPPRLRVLAIASLAFAAGCASDVANRYYASEQYPPKDPSQVELLSKPPNRPYVLLADFQSRGESPEDMRKKAAQIGADAVIVVTLGGYHSSSDQWAGHDSQSTSYSRITASAIRYK